MRREPAMNLGQILSSHVKGALAVVVAVMLVGCFSLAGCANSTQLPGTGLAGSAENAQGILSFTLESTDWVQDEDGAIMVKITGTSADGESVDEQYRAVPDLKYMTPLHAGEYEIFLLDGVSINGDRPYKAEAQKVSFDGADNMNVVLTMTLDAEAMAQ